MGVNNEKGLTLVEVLAVLAIGSMILLFIAGTNIFVQNQYQSQSADSKQLTDEIQALKAITRKVRMADGEIVVNSHDNSITFPDSDSYRYDIGTKTLYRNSSPFISDVENFAIKKETIYELEGTTYEVITLTINNHETEIVLRGSE